MNQFSLKNYVANIIECVVCSTLYLSFNPHDTHFTHEKPEPRAGCITCLSPQGQDPKYGQFNPRHMILITVDAASLIHRFFQDLGTKGVWVRGKDMDPLLNCLKTYSHSFIQQ